MERSDRISALERLKNRTLSNAEMDWTDVCRNIKNGTVLPVIGNALRNDGIFDWYFKSKDIASGNQTIKTVDDYLSLRWADFLEYPLMDTTNLARVAIYNRVLSKSDVEAKENYLLFLKGILLEVAGADPQVQDQVPQLEEQIEQLSFSDLVVELDYPRLPSGKEDPLRCLARMHLPLYITTSYYDFLERTLEAEGYSPRTQICFWSGEQASVPAEHRTQHALELDRDNPVVFHLFGLERYPYTMVVSEGDYMDYLMKLTRDTNTQNPILPLYLTDALASAKLILMGYRLQDWDFRVLYRLIGESKLRPSSLLVQVDPKQLARDILKSDEARKYLEKYFQDKSFIVHWGDPDDFVYQLCAEYKKWTQAES
jgi:SIR2-like domain